MPGAFLAGNKLDNLATPANEEMSGNPEVAESLVIGMRFWIKPVGKQFDHAIAAELIRRQADVVDHQQIYGGSGRALIAVG